MGIYLCHYPSEEILSVYTNPSLNRDFPPSTFSFYELLFRKTLDISTFLQAQTQYYRSLSKKVIKGLLFGIFLSENFSLDLD